MELTKLEKETILNFNELENTASLYTYNEKLQKRFDRIASEYPELVSRTENKHGAVTYEFSKKQMILSFRPPLSEEELERRRERANQHKFKPKQS